MSEDSAIGSEAAMDEPQVSSAVHQSREIVRRFEELDSCLDALDRLAVALPSVVEAELRGEREELAKAIRKGNAGAVLRRRAADVIRYETAALVGAIGIALQRLGEIGSQDFAELDNPYQDYVINLIAIRVCGVKEPRGKNAPTGWEATAVDLATQVVKKAWNGKWSRRGDDLRRLQREPGLYDGGPKVTSIAVACATELLQVSERTIFSAWEAQDWKFEELRSEFDRQVGSDS